MLWIWHSKHPFPTSSGFNIWVQQKALLSRWERCKERLKDLQKRREEKAQELREVYAEIKALERIKASHEEEERRKGVQREQMNLSFFHSIRKGLLLLLIVFPLLSFGDSALSKKIKQEQRKKAEQDLSVINKELERRLKKIEEEKRALETERRRLEELKKQREQVEVRPEEHKDVEKWVAIINKTSPDEAGAMMNQLDARLVAKIMLRLKERQAAQILEAMDPQKSAEVSKIIMESKISQGGKP